MPPPPRLPRPTLSAAAPRRRRRLPTQTGCAVLRPHLAARATLGAAPRAAGRRGRRVRRRGGKQALDASPRHQAMTAGGRRRLVAGPDARRPHHPHIRAGGLAGFGDQRLGAGQHATDPVADAHGLRRRRPLAGVDNVEMGVKAGALVNLGHRHFHLRGQRGQHRRRQMSGVVMQAVQMFDQQIRAPRRVP